MDKIFDRFRRKLMTEALQLAHEELLKSDATTKHIIFLSDGDRAIVIHDCCSKFS